jgi:prepilin-type N-terminal cleavage/methylation domain-containing protein/prepilin-type processing-associated H-X9-DG protein
MNAWTSSNRASLARPVPRGCFRGDGFTLIELLIVTAIVGILATMLLPVLAKAKSTSQGARCLGNAKQLILSWLLYADDHDARLCPNTTERTGGWVSGSLDFENLNPDNTNSAWLVESRFARLGSYLGDARVVKCPSDQSKVRIQGRKHDRVRSVSMNLAVGLNVMERWPAINSEWRVYQTAAQIIRPVPADLWVFTDEHPDSIDDASFLMHLQRRGIPSYYYSWPANFHGNGATLSFADGHAEKHRWLDSRTLHENLYCGCLSSYSKAGNFARCPGNRDLAWLQERTSSPLKD